MKKNIGISIILLGVFLISLSSIYAFEYLGTFTQNEPIRISQNCNNATYTNISSINYPNSSVAESNIQMLYSGNGEFYYLFENTTQLGRYNVRGISDGCENTFSTYFEITTNGKSTPSGIVIIFFNLIFIIIIAGMLSLLLYTVFTFILFDFNAKDLIINVSSYFSLFAFYILGLEYLGNKFINDILLFLIEIGAVTTVILPITAFIVCFIKNGLELKNQDNY